MPWIRIPEATIWKSETRIENRSSQLVELLDVRGVMTGVLIPADGDPDVQTEFSDTQFDAGTADAPINFRQRQQRSWKQRRRCGRQ